MSRLILLLAGTIGCLVAKGDIFVRFCISDTEGNPITNAVINARALAVYHFNAGLRDSDYRHYKAETDARGQTEFQICTRDTRIEWGVKADGFYGTEWGELSFRNKVEGEIIDGDSKDSPKIVKVSLCRKKSPIPAYAFYAYESIRTPRSLGEFGFDLKVGDWLQPFGKGAVADFYLVRQKVDLGERTVAYEFFRFEDGCGFRRFKKLPHKEFPTTYIASTNDPYETELHYMSVKAKDMSAKEIQYESPVSADEFLVLRTRAETNEIGEVVSANYSKLYGPVDVERCFQISQAVFNPTPNDTNLEFDPHKNLNKRFLSCGLRP